MNLMEIKPMTDIKMYNLMYKGTIINNKPMSYSAAEEFRNNTTMNYGYIPEIVEVKNG